MGSNPVPSGGIAVRLPAVSAKAEFSSDGAYRYTLHRDWGGMFDPEPRVLVWCMLNPSTADDKRDDPTIRRCIGFSQRDGYTGLVILNVFALRSTDPRGLALVDDPVGPDNDRWLAEYAAGSDVVVAWGAYRHQRITEVGVMLDGLTGGRLRCLGTTNNGSPRHPLYVAGDTKLTPWQPPTSTM